MSQTEATDAQLAAELFDNVLQPLADARRDAGDQPYFALGPDVGAESYFVRPAVTSMDAMDFDFPGDGTPDSLIAALASQWAAEGEPVLAAAANRLRSIAHALAAASMRKDGNVDIFCYTLF